MFDQKLPRRRKVGDTLTVTAEDEDGNEVDLTDAKIQWYAGEDEIEGETDAELEVTEDMVGEVISVIVTIDDVEYKAETAEVYASLALLSADQTGKSVVTLTTNGPVTALDDIDVLRGTKEVEIDKIDYEEDGAVVTLKDSIKADAEYTVILTPADEDDEATTATFTGEKAELTEIKFLNDVLVMKDNNYDEGYAYVKGYDQFEDEVALSGLTVTPGVGEFKSYDNSTGKITLVDTKKVNGTGAFMFIKEVPVFVQVQSGEKMITGNAVLTVSTRAFLTELEFGDIEKDGTKRDDERLTINELGSRKYYVEIERAVDQYGNDLSAEDLNEQKNSKTSPTLFVIPATTGGAYYATADFGKLNGKLVLWLAPGNGKPGSMPLTITGAGGASFTKDIEIEDNPYIDTLTVTYPDLYAQAAESAEFDFSAVDQYGEEIDLWDIAPSNTMDVTTLNFGDFNNMAQLNTKIEIGNGKFNPVVKDPSTKEFKVTVDMTGVQAKVPVVFTTTTASPKVNTRTITVGERGRAAQIKTTSTGSIQLGGTNAATTDYDFNGKLTFEDENGNTMKRSDGDYPQYADANNFAGGKLLVKAPSTTFKPTNFYWTLVNDEIKTDTTTVTQLGTNGKYAVGEMGQATSDVWVILWGEAGGSAVLLDQESFHFTKVVGTPKTYKATCSDTLYVKKSDSYKDNVEVTVNATTDKGETYKIKADAIKLGGIPFKTENNKVYGNYDLDEVGTVTATVYVGGKETTVDINYTNVAPKATKTSYGYKTGNNGDAKAGATSKYGTEQKGAGPDIIYLDGTNSAIDIKDGVMTLGPDDTYGDGYEAKVVDQYGQDMTDTVFKADGVVITDGMSLTSGKQYSIDYASGTVSGKFYVMIGTVPPTVTVVTKASSSVETIPALKTALAAAKGNGVADTITWTGQADLDKAIDLEQGDTLVIASGAQLKTAKVADDPTDDAINGTLENNGILTLQDDMSVGNKGTIVNNGTFQDDGTARTITVSGKFVNNKTVTGVAGSKITGTGTYTNKAGTTTTIGTIDMTAANTLENFGTVVAGTIKGYVLLGNGSTTEATTSFAPKGLIVNKNSVAEITEGSYTLTLDTTATGEESEFKVVDGTNDKVEVAIVSGAAVYSDSDKDVGTLVASDIVETAAFAVGSGKDVKVDLAQADESSEDPKYSISSVKVDGEAASNITIDTDGVVSIPASVFAGKTGGETVIVDFTMTYVDEDEDTVSASVTVTVDVYDVQALQTTYTELTDVTEDQVKAKGDSDLATLKSKLEKFKKDYTALDPAAQELIDVDETALTTLEGWITARETDLAEEVAIGKLTKTQTDNAATDKLLHIDLTGLDKFNLKSATAVKTTGDGTVGSQTNLLNGTLELSGAKAGEVYTVTYKTALDNEIAIVVTTGAAKAQAIAAKTLEATEGTALSSGNTVDVKDQYGQAYKGDISFTLGDDATTAGSLTADADNPGASFSAGTITLTTDNTTAAGSYTVHVWALNTGSDTTDATAIGTITIAVADGT